MTQHLRKTTPIQIIGTQRSGSNLLRVMLNELKEVSAPHPPHILKVFMPLIKNYPDLNEKANFEVLVDDVCRLIETNPVEWENLKLDREEVLSRCDHPTIIQVFRAVYELMAEANEAKFWCCKSMDNAYYADEMEQEGVHPYYIHLVRDGRDVASSFKRVAVGEKHIYNLAVKWKSDQMSSESVVNKYGPERAIVIRYEDLLEVPEKVMKSICNFIGVTYSEKVFDYFKSSEGQHTAASGFMWHNLTSPILKGNTRKFVTSLSGEEIGLFEHVAGKDLQHYNYDLVGKNSVILTDDMIGHFNEQNERLKREIRNQSHLKIDLEKRRDQENLIEEVKERLRENSHVKKLNVF